MAYSKAHVGDRAFPIVKLSDENLTEIQLGDGFVNEWFDLVGEPTLTLLDFSSLEDFVALDPSDLDFRIWLAWHDEPTRIYVAFVASDDVYKNTHDYQLIDAIFLNDSIQVAIDGDHSGGAGLTGSSSDEEILEAEGQTQRYEAISHTANGPNLDSPAVRFRTGTTPWMTSPPYAEGGGSVAGEAPTISTIEFYITPFDRWETFENPEGSVVSSLTAGQVIGFAIMVNDWDREDDLWTPWIPDAMQHTDREGYLDLIFGKADVFLDGILLPLEPEDSAIGATSWGRIKATLK